MDRRKQNRRKEFCSSARSREKTPGGSCRSESARHDVLAAEGFRQAGHQGRARASEKGRECLEEQKSFCSVCAPRVLTWSSDTPAAQSCLCMTRSMVVAFATS